MIVYQFNTLQIREIRRFFDENTLYILTKICKFLLQDYILHFTDQLLGFDTFKALFQCIFKSVITNHKH